MTGLYLYEGSQIWVEEGEPGKTSKCQVAYEDAQNRAVLSHPSRMDCDAGADAASEEKEETKDEELVVDLRWPVATLRLLLAQRLAVQPDTFRIKLKNYRECKDETRTLREEGYSKEDGVRLFPGQPPSTGDFYLKCFLFDISGCSFGVRHAPLVETEEEVARGGAEGAVSQRTGEEDSIDEVFVLGSGGNGDEAPPPEDDGVSVSDFGTVMVQNSALLSDFDAIPIEVLVREDTTVEELRERIATRLVARALVKPVPGESAHAGRVRIRDKHGSRAGRIIRDGRTVKAALGTVFEGKELAVSILPSPEALEPGSAVVWCVRWRRKEWALSERFEVLVRPDEPLHELNRRLAALCGIANPEDVRVLRVLPYTTLKLADLDSRPWAAAVEETGWKKLGGEATKGCKVSAASFNFLEASSDLLVVQDTSEPLRPLTPADRRSLTGSTSTSASSAFTSSSLSWASKSMGPSSACLPPRPFVKPKEMGIMIKTRQDREREAERDNEEGSGGVVIGNEKHFSSAQSDSDLWGDDEPPPLVDDDSADILSATFCTDVNTMTELD